MSAPRASKLVFAAALAVLSACVDTVVVGNQEPPGPALDADPPPLPAPEAGGDDAGVEPALDAGRDTGPPLDASQPPDTGPSQSDSGADGDGGPVVVNFSDGGGTHDGGCFGLRCAHDASVFGPCSTCDVATLIAPDACPSGPPPVCWEVDALSCDVVCPPAAVCRDSDDCSPDEYCFFASNDCGARGPGWCAPRPRGQCTIGEAVCGCDGERYQNGCYATQAGVHTSQDETRCH